MQLDENDWQNCIPNFCLYDCRRVCLYEKQKKYLLTMLSLGVGCQIVYYVVLHSLYMGILMTFSISIGMIYILEYAEKKRTAGAVLGRF